MTAKNQCWSTFCDPYVHLRLEAKDKVLEADLNARFGGFYILEKPFKTINKYSYVRYVRIERIFYVYADFSLYKILQS